MRSTFVSGPRQRLQHSVFERVAKQIRAAGEREEMQGGCPLVLARRRPLGRSGQPRRPGLALETHSFRMRVGDCRRGRRACSGIRHSSTPSRNPIFPDAWKRPWIFFRSCRSDEDSLLLSLLGCPRSTCRFPAYLDVPGPSKKARRPTVARFLKDLLDPTQHGLLGQNNRSDWNCVPAMPSAALDNVRMFTKAENDFICKLVTAALGLGANFTKTARKFSGPTCGRSSRLRWICPPRPPM